MRGLGDIGPLLPALGPAPTAERAHDIDCHADPRTHWDDCECWCHESAKPTRTRGPMPTVLYGGKTYKVRSRKTEIPDLSGMTQSGALVWLIRNTYPTGTNHRRPRPNLGGLKLEVR